VDKSAIDDGAEPLARLYEIFNDKGPPTITISKFSQVKYWKCHLGRDGIRPGLDVPIQKGGHRVAPDWQPRVGTALTCGDVQVQPDFCSRGRLIAPSILIGRPDHSANLLEPSVCMIRFQGCWPFCPGGCSRERLYPFRSHAEASWSTMDREASMKGRPRRASPAQRGAEV